MREIQKFIYIPIFAIALVFVASRFYPILTRVSIKTASIKDGEVLNGNIVKILGSAKKATNLYINGKSTSVTKDGEFEDAIALPEGYNVVTITAIDKFGKISSKTMKLSVNPDTNSISVLDIINNHN